MSKVRFMQSKTKGTYLTDWNSDIDCSGDYYPATDVERLVESAQGALDIIKFLNGNFGELEEDLELFESTGPNS